jgi:hypothetical protein
VALRDMVIRVLGFLRVGYPAVMPVEGYVPLSALLPRRLSDDEVTVVASGLTAVGEIPIDGTSMSVAVSKLTDELPSRADVERVKQRLEALGWPISD